MKIAIVFSLILCARLCFAETAFEQLRPNPDCAAELRDDFYAKDLLRIANVSDYPTTSSVRVTTSLETLHGHKLKKLIRIGSVWESLHRPKRNAPEFDPRSLILALGPESAADFGSKMLSDREMTATTATILTSIIREANDRLSNHPDRGHTFKLLFVTPKTKYLSNRQYVIYFVHYLIPIAANGPMYVHDIGVHALSFLIPDRFLQFAQLQARTIVNFEKYFSARNPEIANSPGVSKYFSTLYDEQSDRIDNGTGNFGMSLSRGDLRMAAYGLRRLVVYGRSPAEIILATVQHLQIEYALDSRQASLLQSEFQKFVDLNARDQKTDLNSYMEDNLVETENEIHARINDLKTAQRMKQKEAQQ